MFAVASADRAAAEPQIGSRQGSRRLMIREKKSSSMPVKRGKPAAGAKVVRAAVSNVAAKACVPATGRAPRSQSSGAATKPSGTQTEGAKKGTAKRPVAKSAVAQEQRPPPAPPAEDCMTSPTTAGKAVVLYNHYKSEFKVDAQGRLAWADVDDEYCISFVFSGNYLVSLKSDAGETILREADGCFHGLADGNRYHLCVQEDAETAAASAIAAKAIADRNRARREEEQRQSSLTKSKVDDITQQLKDLKPEDRTVRTKDFTHRACQRLFLAHSHA